MNKKTLALGPIIISIVLVAGCADQQIKIPEG